MVWTCLYLQLVHTVHRSLWISLGHYCTHVLGFPLLQRSPWPKAPCRGKGLFHLASCNPERFGQDTWRQELMPWKRLLACSLRPASLLPYIPQDNLSRGCITHSELGPPISITNLGNALEVFLQVDLLEAFTQLRLPALRWLQLVSSWYKSSTHSHRTILPAP